MRDEEENLHVPLGVLLVSKGNTGERLLFLHPFQRVEPEPLPVQKGPCSNTRKGNEHCSQYHSTTSSQLSFPTQFGLSTDMLANILSVKAASCNQKFEMKVDNVRFAGYPKCVTDPEGCSEIFSIIFVLPSNVDDHLVESFQCLSQKLALAIDTLQTMNKYFLHQEREMLAAADELYDKDIDLHNVNPWEKVVNRSRLAHLLSRVYDDVTRSGVVQVFVDDFIEVGFCVESRAFVHCHLAPKNRSEIDRLVEMIRPYHGILLLEDVWPTPDGNPSVALLLKHSSPDRSILDISTASGIPLLQCFLIVRHLLLWARALVIYPLADTNMYTSATRPRPLSKQIVRFSRHFGTGVHLAAALAHFNPPSTLESFVKKRMLLSDQQTRAKVVVFLLRHQLIMQLHKFCYILKPFSKDELPKKSERIPLTGLQQMIQEGDLDEEVKPIVLDMCGEMLTKESYSKVERRLKLFLRMSPYMKGMHHVEDIIYRLNEERRTVEDVINAFSLVLSTFFRPDFIAE